MQCLMLYDTPGTLFAFPVLLLHSVIFVSFSRLPFFHLLAFSSTAFRCCSIILHTVFLLFYRSFNIPLLPLFFSPSGFLNYFPCSSFLFSSSFFLSFCASFLGSSFFPLPTSFVTLFSPFLFPSFLFLIFPFHLLIFSCFLFPSFTDLFCPTIFFLPLLLSYLALFSSPFFSVSLLSLVSPFFILLSLPQHPILFFSCVILHPHPFSPHLCSCHFLSFPSFSFNSIPFPTLIFCSLPFPALIILFLT